MLITTTTHDGDDLFLERIITETSVLWIFLLLLPLGDVDHLDDFLSVGWRLKLVLQSTLNLLRLLNFENVSLDDVDIPTELFF